MKSAICFYGLHPDETWKATCGWEEVLKKEDKCLEYWNKNIIDRNDPDIFIHSFSKIPENLLEYNPKKYLFEDENIFINLPENKKKIEKLKRIWRKHKMSHEIKLNFLISYGIMKSVELMKKYSVENNIDYDCIMLARVDCCFVKPINFSIFDTNFFNTGIWGSNNIHGKNFNGFLGWWFVSNFNNILQYSKIYLNIEEYLNKFLNYHVISKYHTNTFTDRIIYKLQDCDSTVNNKDIHYGLQRYLEYRKYFDYSTNK